MAEPERLDAMTENQRGTTRQPPWQRDADGESVPFGPWLRRQREMREITLREISDSTKISLRYLEALEDERFDLLPAMVFAKGFLRQYSRYVGLDPDEVVNRFLVASQDEAPEEDELSEAEETARVSGAFEGTWKYAFLVVVAAIVLLALAFLIPRLLGGDGEAGAPEGMRPPEFVAPPGERDEPGPSDDSGTTTVRPPASGDEDPGPRIVPEAPLRVTLDFREDCWVEAVVDGARRVSEMRVQGESLQLQAQQTVELRLGNAGVVDIEVNGRPYLLDAAPGDVRRVEIDLSDVPGAWPEEDAAPEGGGGGAQAIPAAPQP